MYTCNTFLPAGIIQVYLGEDQTQGGRRPPDVLPYLLPIRTILGKLIAGDDRPFSQIHTFSGKDDPGNLYPYRGKPAMYIIHEEFSVDYFKQYPDLFSTLTNSKYRRIVLEGVSSAVSTAFSCSGNTSQDESSAPFGGQTDAASYHGTSGKNPAGIGTEPRLGNSGG
jgi:hypothetical protein